MKIATWNVNSLKVRQQHVIDWLATSGVDVLCLQELKLTDDKFPVAELEAAGYKSWYAGQKTYNGVGILVRSGLTVDETTIVRNIPAFEDPQQRVIAVTVEDALAGSAARLDTSRNEKLSATGSARRLQHRAGRSRCARPESMGRPEPCFTR